MAVSFFGFLIAQVVAPALESLLDDLEATNGRYTYAILAEYWLRLSIANTYLWLLVFYTYFHLYLNLCAELLRFGDRVFYRCVFCVSSFCIAIISHSPIPIIACVFVPTETGGIRVKCPHFGVFGICRYTTGLFGTSISHAYDAIFLKSERPWLFSSFLQ